MKKKKIKTRNWLAVHAWNRKGGLHEDKKKKKSRKACRGKVKQFDD